MFPSHKHRLCFPSNTLCNSLRSSSQCSRAEMPRTHSQLCLLSVAAVASWLSKMTSVCLLHAATSVRSRRAKYNSSSWTASRLLSSCSTAWTFPAVNGKGKRQSHGPRFGARKPKETIEHFRWWWVECLCQEHCSLTLPSTLCIQRHQHPKIPSFPLRELREASDLSPQCHSSGHTARRTGERDSSHNLPPWTV